MKLRVLILVLFVIVLVSVTWFKMLVAQDLSKLTVEEKYRLLKESQKKLPQGPESEYYQSPPIFDDTHMPGSGVAKMEELSKGMAPGERDSTLVSSSTSPDTHPLDSGHMPEFEQLRPFGMNLFQGPQQIDPPIDIASAADYILGPSDNVIIYLWGRVEKEYNLTLDREGKVFIPRVGEIIGWGLTLEKFTQRAQKQFSTVYSEFDLTVSLGKIRSIRLYVTGEVKRPGAYTVSSLTSLFNAIYIAGGPNERGSMRTIKLMRNGKPITTVDLYKLLLKGDNSTDIRLQTGDVVFVPVAGPRVAIRGEMNRSAVYELKGGETAFDLLALAGNSTPQAYLDRVMLERISPTNEWEVLDLNLNTENGLPIDTLMLTDGDRLTVFSIYDAKTNMVAIFGRVKHPGYYERNDSTRVSDLISQSQLQPYDIYYGRADLFRRYHDYRIEVIPINLTEILTGGSDADLLLENRDSLHIYAIDDVEWNRIVYIEGEVKIPGQYPLYDNITVADLIFLAGSFTRGADLHQAEIARMDSLGNISLLYVNLDDSVPQQTYLCEDDHLYIRKIPDWQLHRTVTIKGEVNYPGRYTLSSREETLYHLLQRTGGFTLNAFPKGIVFERKTIKDHLQRLKVPELLDRSQPLVEDSLGNLVKQNVFQYDFNSMNRVIIDIDKILSTEGREGNIVMEPGDHIYIPSVPSGISVMGAIGANGTIKFMPNKKAKYYIERAGNFTRRSDKKEVRLIRAGGEVISGRGTLGKRVELGDVIIVPTKIEKERKWFKTLTTALSATTGFLTSVYIVSKI